MTLTDEEMTRALIGAAVLILSLAGAGWFAAWLNRKDDQ